MKDFIFLVALVSLFFNIAWGKTYNPRFNLTYAPYTRLCETKNILTINGEFPGPTIFARKGDTVNVDFFNEADRNVTLHWHGVEQPGNPWTDGPAYITQCPLQPGTNFTYTIVLSVEVGTLWWHAHSEWDRATVYGTIVIHPERGTVYPFPQPHKDVPVMLGSWWKKDVLEVMEEALTSGGEPNTTDAHTINGQPGDLYPCSSNGTTKQMVEQGKTYLLRVVNAGMDAEYFFSVAQHNLTLVGLDGFYVKPYTTDVLMIIGGQTMDVLLTANQPHGNYYFGARPYASADSVNFDNRTTTAIFQYHNRSHVPPMSSSSPILPTLPDYNNTGLVTNITMNIKSLIDVNHTVNVPLTIDNRMFITISVNTLPCAANNTCDGPNGTRLAASFNNMTFEAPSTDILSAYHRSINGIYQSNFPSKPHSTFNFTADSIPLNFSTSNPGTRIKYLDFNSTVEIIFQGTNLLAGENHPIHLHGYTFYVVGYGLGNFDRRKDPQTYNLIDPPKMNTIGVPKNGWATIRFRADNPGVWFMHCHIERHASWGMETVFIVKNGKDAGNPLVKMRPPPTYMPPC